MDERKATLNVQPENPNTAMNDETLICRCEEVPLGAIRTALRDGAASVNDVKRRTRAGMGLCQGVYCTRAIARILHDEAGLSLESIEPMTARPPMRPVPLAALIAAADLET